MTWTIRNTVNVILAALSGATLIALGVSSLGLGAVERAWLQGTALGLLVGCVTPGSPVGRALDVLFPMPVKVAEAALVRSVQVEAAAKEKPDA